MHSTEASLDSRLKEISWKSSSVLFFNDRAFVSTMAGRWGRRLRRRNRVNTPARLPRLRERLWVESRWKVRPFVCVCVLSCDKSSEKYKSLGRYSQFIVCSMCSKSLRSYVYIHTQSFQTTEPTESHKLSHRHFTSPFIGTILDSTSSSTLTVN